MSANPAIVVESLMAYWRSDALVAAIDLGVFTAVGDRSRTVRQIAASCRLDASALTPLCDYLVGEKLLAVRANRYRLTATARRFLDERSPAALTTITTFFNGRVLRRCFAALPRTVRNGRPALGAAMRRRLWVEFARSALPLRKLDAAATVRDLLRLGAVRGRILDVGAGASPLGLELLRRAPSTSLVVQDRRGVVTVAMEQARRAGLADRVAAFAGSIERRSATGPFDLALLINVLDYVQPSARERVLRNVRAALRPGGAIVLRTPMLGGSHAGHREAVDYNLLVLALTGAGAVTAGELSRLLHRVGFATPRRSARSSLMLARVPR